MPVITNTDTTGHWCDVLKQWIPARCSVNVTSAQASAVPSHVFSTATTLETVETAPEDGTPTRVTRSHR